LDRGRKEERKGNIMEEVNLFKVHCSSTGGVAQVVECLLCKHKTLHLNSSLIKNKNKT
jgi:hypothetical protein